MNAQEKKHRYMTESPIRPLIMKLAIPTIISMLVTALYNMADTLFVGRIGTNATAGVGLIFPIMAIIQAFGFFFGQGSGNFISRSLGAKNEKESQEMAATGAVSAFGFGLLILIIGLVFSGPILSLLGAKESQVALETIGFAGDYYKIILIGAPFMCLSCVLNNQLRFQGNAVFSMIGLVSGAVLNCGLDPLFIFTFDMKVAGAALATIISQIVSCGILYAGTLKSDSLKIHLKDFRCTLYYYKNIAIGGLPSLFRQSLASLASVCLNRAAGAAVPVASADAAIAAFSIVGKIMMFVFSALLGFGQGFQPFCGFNYGAKLYGRVREGYTFCLRVGLCTLLGLCILGFAFPEPIISVFRDDPDVIVYGSTALRYQCSVFPLLAVVCLTNMLYQNIGRVGPATFLAIARQGLVFIPCVLILPGLFANPINGVYLSQPAADVITFCFALYFAIKGYRELKQKELEMMA